jgi:TolB-like protein
MVTTSSEAVIGTVPYMSPEQVLGRDVDHRSDLFSVGVVLYEMATGQSPFAGANSSETLDRILNVQPHAISHFNRDVPVELERIVGKCLEKDRDRRYSSARELLADLKNVTRHLDEGVSATATASRETRRGRFTFIHWLAISLLLIVAIALLAYRLSFRGAPAALSPQIASIAVLPLENLSGDPAQEYFADGMTESLIGNLARIGALRVISRTSVMHFKRSSKRLPDIARELNVDAVIEGSVQRSGGRVRVTAQLIHAATDTHLWARVYERDLTDVLKLQSEVAAEVAREIRIQVTSQERARLASARSVNPQAHEAYLLGRYHFSNGNPAGWKQAIAYFNRAIQIAPDYAAAYAGLSMAWQQQGGFGAADVKDVQSPARIAALKAIETDEQVAEGHIAIGNISYLYDWDWTHAEEEFRRALELDPGSVDAHTHYGHLLMFVGRHDAAIREGQAAVQLDPLSSSGWASLGWFFFRARRNGEALQHLERALELEPRNVVAHSRLGIVYTEMGKFDEAIATFERHRQLAPGAGNFINAGIARVYALAGRQREARQMIGSLKGDRFGIAAVYAALGDKDSAFSVLEEAIEQREASVAVKVDPSLANLHSDPRWKPLLRRMNYPPD